MKVTPVPKECPDCECPLQMVREPDGQGGFSSVRECPWYLPAAALLRFEVGGVAVWPCGKPYSRSSRVF